MGFNFNDIKKRNQEREKEWDDFNRREALKNARILEDDTDISSMEGFFSVNVKKDDRKITFKNALLDPAKLKDYGNHPFKPWDQKTHDEVKESVLAVGFLERAIVRRLDPAGTKYEIIAGHNRRNLAAELGMKLPCVIAECNDTEAEHIMYATNLLRRAGEGMTPTERAELYLGFYKNTIKLYEENTDLEEAEIAKAAIETITKELSVSKSTAYNYIGLNDLTEENKKDVDSGELSLRKAVILSNLTREQQEAIAEYEEKNDTLNETELKKISKEKDEITDADDIEKILNKKSKGRPKKQPAFVSFTKSELEEYNLPDDAEEIKNILIEYMRTL